MMRMVPSPKEGKRSVTTQQNQFIEQSLSKRYRAPSNLRFNSKTESKLTTFKDKNGQNGLKYIHNYHKKLGGQVDKQILLMNKHKLKHQFQQSTANAKLASVLAQRNNSSSPAVNGGYIKIDGKHKNLKQFMALR